MKPESMYPDVRIPYGAWGCSPFPAWQTSALAEVNIGQFAGEAMNRILGRRKISSSVLESLIIGSTIPWHWKFWNAPMVASCLGRRIPGFHVEQACATGLQAVLLAGGEVQAGTCAVAGALTFDRTSDSPASVFPERRAYRRTEVISDVWDNFGFDPAAGQSMIETAGNAALRHRIERREVDEIAFLRHEQYFKAKSQGFLDRFIEPMDILNVQGRPLGRIEEDTGIRRLSLEALRAMWELKPCVTGGTQTHAADGMAMLLVASRERAGELSRRPEVDIRMMVKAEVRVGPAMMPEAPAQAVLKLLDRTGMRLDDMAVVKSHNPFAVNDAVFAKVCGFDWREMNRTGCSLVYGHPQGPTMTRIVVEALEEAVDLGGGYALVLGCAAGDMGVAALFRVG
ncbi:MAG: thiolase family protein [Deltaproteobacteria bacterium]|nr:thiolase family protein [Deltaproteobacteria bacterium]